jgi:hypothetical protein
MISIFEMRTMAPEAKVHDVGGALMDAAHTLPPGIYGLMAEFDDPTSLVAAARRDLRGRLPEDRHVLAVSDRGSVGGDRPPRSRLSRSCSAAASTGLLSGIGLQEWVHQLAYPINIAGKPLNSWPQFVPVCFELTILFAALSAVLGMIC